MQAGETLKFITPFSEAERPQDVSDKVPDEDVAILSLILKRFINEQQENVNAFEVLEPYGFVTVFEASYRLDMEDESYLHIAVFGTQNDDGLLSFGATVNEHLSDGSYNGGHSYIYDAKGLHRSTSSPDLSDDSEEGKEYLKTHFMLSDFYAHRDMIEEARLSDDLDDREHAEQEQRRIDDELAFDEITEMSGFDNQPPYPGEMEKLQALIWNARPFPLHATSEE